MGFLMFSVGSKKNIGKKSVEYGVVCSYSIAVSIYRVSSNAYLIHYSPVFSFSISRQRQQTKYFLMFSGGIETDHWAKMG